MNCLAQHGREVAVRHLVAEQSRELIELGLERRVQRDAQREDFRRNGRQRGARPRRTKVALRLLARLREIVTVDWRMTAQARARVRSAIEETLDEGLPRAYTPDVFKAKAGAVFQHVYEHFGVAA